MLKDKRQDLLKHIADNAKYLKHNHDLYEIYNGKLEPFVFDVLEKTLSPQYLMPAKHRMVLINILERYINKVSGAYENPPTRVCAPGFESSQAVIDWYVREFGMNVRGQVADKYSHLFKGFAWEPYLDDSNENSVKPKLRVIPFDRFLVYSENLVDPSKEDIFISIIGKQNDKMIYYSYSNNEIDAFDEDGATYMPALEGNDGVNPYGVIPQTYGNRADNELMPYQDTDILSITKLVPVVLSDISMSFFYQCFSIIYGINLDMAGANISPNALWSFKSDPDSNAVPSLGTIKPEADTEKGMSFLMNTFTLWLETKGIKVGSVGNISAGNASSGISKIIDEMDVYRVVKESIQWFQKDEQEFWQKMIPIHNNWVDTRQLVGVPRLPDNLELVITFPEPQPKRAKKDIIEEKKLEVEAGFKSKRKAIMELNPGMSDEELEEELKEINGVVANEVPTIL